MRIALKRPNEDIKLLETDKIYRIDAAKSLIKINEKVFGIDYISMNETQTLYACINGGAAFEGLEENFYFLTDLVEPRRLLGDVVFLRIKPNSNINSYDYELDDLTDIDYFTIKNKFLEKKYQALAKKDYERTYKANNDFNMIKYNNVDELIEDVFGRKE